MAMIKSLATSNQDQDDGASEQATTASFMVYFYGIYPLKVHPSEGFSIFGIM
jgi:hypothetical protein